MAALTFTPVEQTQLINKYRQLNQLCADLDDPVDLRAVRMLIDRAAKAGHFERDKHGLNPILHDLDTAVTFCDRVSPDGNIVLAILANRLCSVGFLKIEEVEKEWGADVAKLVRGMLKVASLYG
ncbi:MAG: hypothetical protein K2G40_03580, partial [Muribaculaceae bacterium]|nr:hypothetical protein [Muribaculaceae bacterium]